MEIKISETCPEIALKLREKLECIDDADNYCFRIQLNYYDNNTLIHLKDVKNISFDDYWIDINLKNNSTMLLNYEYVLEYSILNVKDVENKLDVI